MSLVKHSVGVDRFSLDWRRKLVEDDAAEAAVDSEHEKLGVSPGCHGISRRDDLVKHRGSQLEHLGDDRETLFVICLEKRFISESFFDQSNFPTEIKLVCFRSVVHTQHNIHLILTASCTPELSPCA
jgi:hypothetical protein